MNANEMAKRAARLAQRNPSRAPVSADTEQRQVVRTDPVRITTDLAPRAHRKLNAFCAKAADLAGRPRVPHSEVVRALLDLLDEDPKLRAAVVERVRVIQ